MSDLKPGTYDVTVDAPPKIKVIMYGYDADVLLKLHERIAQLETDALVDAAFIEFQAERFRGARQLIENLSRTINAYGEHFAKELDL